MTDAKVDTLEDAAKTKEIDDWITNIHKEYDEQFGSGVIEMDGNMVKTFFMNAVKFWKDRKPELPPLGKPLGAIDILKTKVCLHEIAALQHKIQSADAAAEIYRDSDDDNDSGDEGNH